MPLIFIKFGPNLMSPKFYRNLVLYVKLFKSGILNIEVLLMFCFKLFFKLFNLKTFYFLNLRFFLLTVLK